jgi:nucleoside-diphosphate-sugar epimerase
LAATAGSADEALVGIIGEAMGVDSLIESNPARNRRVDRPNQLSSVMPMKGRLGWAARIPLDHAVEDIVRNFAFTDLVAGTTL